MSAAEGVEEVVFVRVTLEMDETEITTVCAATREREYFYFFCDIFCGSFLVANWKPLLSSKNEKGRLYQEEIERIFSDAEKFTAEDEVHFSQLLAFRSLASFVYGCTRPLDLSKKHKKKQCGGEFCRCERRVV